MNDKNGLKKRYKMYKSGKFWVVAGLFFLGTGTLKVTVANAEGLNLMGNDQIAVHNILNYSASLNPLDTKLVDGNMTISDNLYNPQKAPIDVDSTYYTNRVYKNVAETEYYTISVPREKRQNAAVKNMKITEWEKKDNKYTEVKTTVLKPGEKYQVNGKEFSLFDSGQKYYYRSLNPATSTGTVKIAYDWLTKNITELLHTANGYNTANPASSDGVPFPGEITTTVTFRDNLGQKVTDSTGKEIPDETYTLLNGQTYEYDEKALLDVPGYTLKKPENMTGALQDPNTKEVSIKFVYEFDKEAYKEIKLADLDKVIQETNDKINGDTNLTETEKTEQLKEVEEAGNTAKKAIEEADTADKLNAAFETGKTDIESKYVKGIPLDEQKTKALADLDKVIQDTNKKINDDNNLTQVEKDKQLKEVEEAGNTAKGAINKANTPDELKTALDTGKGDIEEKYVAGTPLDEQKIKVLADLDKVIKETNNKINNDKNLTQIEKDKQLEAVVEAGKAAEQAINDSKTADDLNTALDSGSKEIRSKYQQGSPLEEQQTQALENLDKVVKATKEKINADDNLTKAQKEEQLTAVDNASDTAKKAINESKTADELKLALENGTKDIESKYHPGAPLDEQKTTALVDLDKVITDTKEKIKGDTNLTETEKKEQLKEVDDAAVVAKKEISDATNAENLSKALEKGTKDIESKYHPGTPLDNQKEKALTDLEKVMTDTKKAIDEDPTLTTTEKEIQKKAVNETGQLAKDAINGTSTADELEKAVETGTASIIKEHKPGDGLDVRKEASKELIDKAVAETKEAIKNDPTLIKEEKEAQTKLAEEAGETAKEAINKAENTDQINQETAKGIEIVNNQHKSGDSLDLRKEEAKKAIDEEAKLIKEKIANEPTLTKEEKEIQSNKVDEEASKAKESIDEATTADSVDEAKGKGIELIDKQYQPGTSLDVRKETAKDAIDEEAKLIKENIANEPTLTKEEKEIQSNKVDEEASKAKETIDAATTADSVDEAKGKGIELIDNQYQPGSSLDVRKEAAKDAIDEEAKLIKEKIANDSTLTAEEKEIQSNKVDGEASKAKETIDAATTADNVDEAKGKGIELIDNQHQPGSSLDVRKDSAKEAIDAEAAKIKERINNDPTLTAEEKAIQSGGVDQEAVNAKGAIDAATTADGVDEAKGKGIELIDKQHQSGDSLDTRKDSAKEAIDAEAAKIKERINNDPTLTAEEKAVQSGGVDQEATNAKGAIDAATTADGVDEAKGKGIELINNQYEPGVSIDSRKDAAKKAIDQEANLIKERINNDPTLTNEEKASQSSNADAEAVKAKESIDAAVDANGVDSSKGQGITNIDNQYQTSQPLEERKEAAKAGIDEAAQSAKDRIANDLTLTDEEKATQSAGVDAEAAKAKGAIDAAVDASGVDSSKGQGVTNIDNNYQPGTALNERKELAKADIDEAAQATKEKINNDPTLTDEEKATQSAGVDEAATKAKETIDAAVDANGVDRAKGEGITNIDKNYQPGTPLNKRKELAKADIDEAAKATKEKINNDVTLTNEEKATQSAEVDEAATKAKEAIDAAETADAVDASKGEGITNIDKAYQPGSALDLRKEEAKKAIDEAAKTTKEKINNDATLTKAEKEKQSNSVDTEATKAKETIDAAETADAVDASKGEGITNIDKAYQPGSALDLRKEEAKKAIDEAAKTTKEKVNNDVTLTKEEKKKQSDAVDTEATKAKKAIDVAKTADAVDASKGEGITNIDKAYQPGSALDLRKEEAKKAIDEAAKATKEKINNDATLTKAEKEKQSDAVETEATKAKKAIDVAKTADAVDASKGEGITNIDKAYQPGSALDLRKEDAKKAIDEAAKATKEKINNDVTLTKEEKKKQNDAVDAEAKKAKTAIDMAKTPDEIDQAKGQGITDVSKQHESGKAINEQKEIAKNELDKVAEATKEKIRNDKNLTNSQKEAQIKAVDEALVKAKADIDEAKTADDIVKTKVESITLVESQYKPGKQITGTNTGGKGTSSGGGYTSSGTSGKTGYSALPKTGSEQNSYLAGLVGFVLSGLALLGFRKRREIEEK
ncbi:DUF1542 domain-containing protein [Vagococcus carniphilus]|uniref:DUF1542 domain-containing protein n=1 Tax=Vagococcus carniphilus TaxID=218144 RepID=A0AAW8U6J6_9ENTE|nr:DUF1542 domain-containing protein [Vagococcus carniphilus]MDT2832937.1 DUF1542 domain-containing protein [Vagococcus carniphilus]